jgi:hypothetical protein
MRIISSLSRIRYKAKLVNTNVIEGRRYFTPTMAPKGKLQPAARVAGSRQDVWYVLTQFLSDLPHFISLGLREMKGKDASIAG